MHSHTGALMFLYVHPKLPLLISCIFCACECSLAVSVCRGQPIHPKLPHLPHICRCVYVLCMCVSVFQQHAIKMSNDSCSLFTLQPSSLLPEKCLLLVIEDLGLFLQPYIKLLCRGGKSAEIFYTSTITATSASAPFKADFSDS